MNAYQVKLPVFEGPFDLLFHLIEDQKLNIYDIPIAQVTAQYLDYLHMMEILDMEVASSFLVMAATLLEIKSKLLLPREPQPEMATGDEDLDEPLPGQDLRTGLVERLLEYKRFKLAALELRNLERGRSRLFTRASSDSRSPLEILQIDVRAGDLLAMYHGLIRRRMHPPVHRVIIDKIGLVERIAQIRKLLQDFHKDLHFVDVLRNRKDRYEVVLSFMAILEMAKRGEIQIRQSDNFKPILLRPVRPESEERSLSATG